MDKLVAEGLDPDLLNREAGFGQSSDFQFKHNDPDWLNAGLRQLLLSAWRAQQGHQRGVREVDLHHLPPLPHSFIALTQPPSLSQTKVDSSLNGNHNMRFIFLWHVRRKIHQKKKTHGYKTL